MLENYIPVLIFISLGLIVGLAMIVLGGFVLAPRRPDPEKTPPMNVVFLHSKTHV